MNTAPRRQVVVVLGPSDAGLTSSLRAGGLVPIALDDNVTIWASPGTVGATDERPAPAAPEPAGLLMTIPDGAAAANTNLSRDQAAAMI